MTVRDYYAKCREVERLMRWNGVEPTLIVFWNFNALPKGTDAMYKDMERFIELCTMFPRHIVLSTSSGSLWTEGAYGGVTRGWEHEAQRAHNTLLSCGINAVDLSKWFEAKATEEVRYASDPLHFNDSKETGTMWKQTFRMIAEAIDTGFLRAGWKITAQWEGQMGEQSKEDDGSTVETPNL